MVGFKINLAGPHLLQTSVGVLYVLLSPLRAVVKSDIPITNHSSFRCLLVCGALTLTPGWISEKNPFCDLVPPQPAGVVTDLRRCDYHAINNVKNDVISDVVYDVINKALFCSVPV